MAMNDFEIKLLSKWLFLKFELTSSCLKIIFRYVSEYKDCEKNKNLILLKYLFHVKYKFINTKLIAMK